MGAGKLDQRIYIRTETTTPDGGGGFDVTTAWVGPIWAGIEIWKSQERVVADLERNQQGYRVTVKNQGRGKTIGAADVIRWKGVEMNVKSAPDAGREIYRTIEGLAHAVVTSNPPPPPDVVVFKVLLKADGTVFTAADGRVLVRNA